MEAVACTTDKLARTRSDHNRRELSEREQVQQELQRVGRACVSVIGAVRRNLAEEGERQHEQPVARRPDDAPRENEADGGQRVEGQVDREAEVVGHAKAAHTDAGDVQRDQTQGSKPSVGTSP